MRALITGIAGFAGSHLTDHLLSQNHEVSGIDIPGAPPDNLSHNLDRITLHEGDLLDKNRIRGILEEARPDWLFHLAAQSAVGASWEAPARTFEINLIAGVHLLDVCASLKNKMRIVLISSADIYGGGGSSVLTEDTPFAPKNPYAVSKLALDLAAGQFGSSKGLDILRMRPMNHTGPRQAPGTVIPDFVKQIAEIEAGKREPVLRTGNLEAQRDFSDVRDIVRAYALAAERGLSDEAYLLCSGRARKIQDVLDHLLSAAKVTIDVEQDSQKMRPSESNVSRASHSKFTEATGWRPEIAFEQTLQDTLDFWRERT